MAKKKPRVHERLLLAVGADRFDRAFTLVKRAVKMEGPQSLEEKLAELQRDEGIDVDELSPAISKALIATANTISSRCKTLRAFNKAEPLLRDLIELAIKTASNHESMVQKRLWENVLRARPPEYRQAVKLARRPKP